MIDLVVRTSMMLLLAWLGAGLLARSAAATRHLLWQCTIVAILAAPLAASYVPRVDVPVSVMSTRFPATQDTPVGAETSAPNVTAAAVVTRNLVPSLPAIWFVGSAVFAIWIVIAHSRAYALVRRAAPGPSELQAEADSLRRDMGIVTVVDVRVIENEFGPLAIGLSRSVILLPANATAWDTSQRRTVLLHELAHVRRGDCRTQALAQVACAAYWFNPLVWLAARRVRAERERACDDEVLSHGALPSSYATHLVGLARGRNAAPLTGAVAMARTKELEGRVRSILAPRVARTSSRRTSRALGCVSALVVMAVLAPRTAVQAADARPMHVFPIEDANTREKKTLLLALDGSDEAVPALIAALKDPDSQVREKAALGLAWRGGWQAVEPLLIAIGDEDAQVREKAAIALGFTGSRRARAALTAALHDRDPQVREKAAAGLIMLGLRPSQP